MTARTKYGIYASNLHSGGAVQVAASFVDRLATPGFTEELNLDAKEMYVEVSRAVMRNLSVSVRPDLPLFVVDRKPIEITSWRGLAGVEHETAFVMFGPLYRPIRARRRLYGYADVTAIVDQEQRISPLRRARAMYSRYWASQADVLIVESDSFLNAFRKRTSREGLRQPSAQVVRNTVNRAVLESQTSVTLLQVPREADGEILLSCVAKDYPHKQLHILPEVRRRLSAHGLNARFVVTLEPSEWMRRDASFREACWNAGPLTVTQLRSLYRSVQGAVFPSLQEASSVTPMEALALGVPLFASDRHFVREVAGDAAYYFDPLDVADIARVIARAFSDPSGMDSRIELGLSIMAGWPDDGDRARRYLQLLSEDASR